jgi:hypothetical protein
MDEQTPASPMKKSFVSRRNITIAVVVLVLVLGGGFAYYFTQANVDPDVQAQKEVAEVVAQVSKIMVLPNETPTLATVTDPEQLRGQAFFTNAKVGDKVLIFSQAKKAILYDPKAHKIVEVAPINLGN